MTERMKMVGDEVAAILYDALFNYGGERRYYPGL